MARSRRGHPLFGASIVQILLTNDDGVFAPGLRALRKELMRLGDVTVVAPALEQSGVAHSITLLTPWSSSRWTTTTARPWAGWSRGARPTASSWRSAS